MNFLCFLVVGALLVILQTTLLMPTPTWFLAPDFYYIFVAYLASRMAVFPSMVLLYILGLMLDVLVGTVLGMSSALCFLGFAVIRLFAVQNVNRDFLYSIPLVSLSFFLLSGLVYCVFALLYPDQIVPWDWGRMCLRALLVAVFTYPLFRLLDMVHSYGTSASLPWKRLRVRSENPRRRQT